MPEQLKAILTRVLPQVDMSAVTRETRLVEDLGFDSLAMMMLAMEIEDAYGFQFEQFVKFDTVGDVYDYLAEKT